MISNYKCCYRREGGRGRGREREREGGREREREREGSTVILKCLTL
jgi:hypothetical protein